MWTMLPAVLISCQVIFISWIIHYETPGWQAVCKRCCWLQTFDTIYSMPEYVHCCHGGTNVYQWWLGGGLMCDISYPSAMCMLKLEESSQHQSITLPLETHLYNTIFRFLHRRWERKISNWIVTSILQNECTLKYFSEWMFRVLRYIHCVAVPTSCVTPCCGIGHLIKMQFHTNELHCQHL
jgi:hypothetical protein